MKVTWKDFTPDEIIVEIECQCGNKRMVYEQSDHVDEKIFVYRYGLKTQCLRCSRPFGTQQCTVQGAYRACKERYRVTLVLEGEDPFVEVEHLGTFPKEVVKVPFPKKVIIPAKPMYDTEPYPNHLFGSIRKQKN